MSDSNMKDLGITDKRQACNFYKSFNEATNCIGDHEDLKKNIERNTKKPITLLSLYQG